MSGTINDQPSRCRIVEGSIQPAGTDPTPAQLERLKRAREIAASHLDPKIAPGTIASIEAGRMDGHVWVRIAYDALGEAAIDANLIQEQISEGHGVWLSCTGCYETSDGQNVHGYPHSRAFGCILGSGCSECGGIGAVWDTTDFEAMGRELAGGNAEMIISGEPWISATCQGELCRCGQPAVRKIGEEFAFDDPNPARHNLTAYVCAVHFAEAFGPAAALQVGLKTLASAGRCHCGFWPCATHQIDDVSTEEENADDSARDS